MRFAFTIGLAPPAMLHQLMDMDDPGVGWVSAET